MQSVYKLVKIEKNHSGSSIAIIKVCDTPRGLFSLPIHKIIKDKKLLANFDSDDIINLVGIASTESEVSIQETKITYQSPKFLNFFYMLFITTMIASNVGSSKLASIFGVTITGGILSFCSSYIIADIVNEVYGYKNVRQLIWYGLLCNIVMVILLEISIALPASPFWANQASFATTLGAVPRILVASLVSYTSSEFINSYILTKLKIKNKHLIIRLFQSTFVGIMADTLLFVVIAFWGQLPINELFYLAVKIYICKSVFEYVLIYPTYRLIRLVKSFEKIDILDYNTNLTPFSLDTEYSSSNNIYDNKL
jgi:uncharacterized integral membrane protein (TIGR00697 family)